MEKVRPWCGQPSDRGRLKNRTDQNCGENKRYGDTTHRWGAICRYGLMISQTDAATHCARGAVPGLATNRDEWRWITGLNGRQLKEEELVTHADGAQLVNMQRINNTWLNQSIQEYCLNAGLSPRLIWLLQYHAKRLAGKNVSEMTHFVLNET